MSVALQKKLAVQREAERARKMVSSVPGITAVSVVPESDIPPAVHDAVRTLLQLEHQPFSTLDESASGLEIAAWLRRCSEKFADRPECWFTAGGTAWLHIQVVPGSDWLVPLWQAFRDMFLLSLPDRTLLGMFEEEHCYEAHLAQWV
jgi:hypothetical protein